MKSRVGCTRLGCQQQSANGPWKQLDHPQRMHCKQPNPEASAQTWHRGLMMQGQLRSYLERGRSTAAAGLWQG